MENSEVRSRRNPRYPDEDVTATTKKELRGFYTYGAAAEVYAVVGVGSFLPVTLEQLARENGVLYSDKTTSCMPNGTDDGGVVRKAVNAMFKRTTDKDNQCVIKPFGLELTSASFAMYTFSLAVFIQALSLVSFSSIADHGGYRKKLLIAFGLVGAVSSMLFLLVPPALYLAAPILAIIGVTCLGSSFVLLNSFLPLLVQNHPSTQQPTIQMANYSVTPRYDTSIDEDEDIVVISETEDHKVDSADLKLSSQISSKGVGIGYIAAVLVQILSIGLLFIMSKHPGVSSTLPLRSVLFIVGVWWFVFTIPSATWLRSRPGPPLDTVFSQRGKWRSFWAYGFFAWASLWKTIKIAVRLRQVTIFLVAWFLLSDAMATVSGTAVIFARTELKMGTVPIALLSITVMVAGIAGAMIWPVISQRFHLQTNQTIVACIIMLEIVPLYGLLGYIPVIQKWEVGGLQQPWEIFPLGFIHGFVMGGLSSYCRSFFGRLIPPGSEAAFYALYAITDKGSSAVGPAIVGRIIDATGHIRPTFIFLAVLVAIPGPMIWIIDVKKGQQDAARMSNILRKAGASQDYVDAGDSTAGGEEAEGLMRHQG